MNPRRIASRLFNGNVAGGFSAFVFALPESLAYGSLVVAPLGVAYLGEGILFGLITFIIINLITPLVNRRSMMVGASFSLSSLMLGSAVSGIATRHGFGDRLDFNGLLSLVFVIVCCAGLFQTLFGLLRLGNLAKYIPYPVLSGLQNGTALLIFWSQLPAIFGLTGGGFPDNPADFLGQAQPLTVAVAICTMVAIAAAARVWPSFPAPLFGLLVGCSVYYLLDQAAPVLELFTDTRLGALVGTVPARALLPEQAPGMALALFGEQALLTPAEFLRDILPASFSIAIVISLRTLISTVSVDNLTQRRTPSNRELAGQGIANSLAAFFGGIPGIGSVTFTAAAWVYGARQYTVKIIAALCGVLTLQFLYPAVGWLPKAVLAAMMLLLARSVFDEWIFRLLADIRHTAGARRRESLRNAFLVLLVTAVMVFIGIFTAVGVGIAVALVMFVMQMGRDVVRRQFGGNSMRSNVERSRQELEILEREGGRIRILELEGVLFFGTADRIAEITETLLEKDTDYVLLDFKKITNVDSTGMRIVEQLGAKAARHGRRVLLTSVAPDQSFYDLFPKDANIFTSLDDGLAWAEDDLIAKTGHAAAGNAEMPLAAMDALCHLRPDEMDILRLSMLHLDFRPGQVVFREGDAGDRVYFLVRGRAQIFISLRGGERQRVSTLATGTVFGEMALIDGKPRSAEVVAEGYLTCYCLSDRALAALVTAHPVVAYKVITGISGELSKRIRIRNAIVAQLRA